MVDPKRAGVSEGDWQKAIASCHELRVLRTVRETHDAMSIVFEIPEALAHEFEYRPGQFLSFKIPFDGHVLTRSYSLASSPDVDTEPKVTVKRVEGGRISNWMNDEVSAGSTLMVVPPAGHFVLQPDSKRDVVLFSAGSGITPCISIIKSALATTGRRVRLLYANRDARSIIFEEELAALATRHPDRLEISHSLDDQAGFVTARGVDGWVRGETDQDFYLCGPDAFMTTVEEALHALQIARERIHIERFLSPPDHDEAEEPAVEAGEIAPATITLVLDGHEHEIPYEPGERVLAAARRAGLDPPFSCEEGYCSCCMAKLVSGEVKMSTNDCLTPDLLKEGWVLTCQSRCTGTKVRLEYPE
jgi:3-ketosteroid 9alpha-monooxygenase subunit B